MLAMISKSKSYCICTRLPCSLKCRHSDYLGAENAGLHALLLRRPGLKGDQERETAEVDLRTTIKSRDIVNDLYGVVAWVEGMNSK